MLLLEGCGRWCRGHLAPPKAPLSFFIQKQHRASEAADCTPDSIDCFPTLFCLFLFIWLLYFRASQSLFWPGRNLLFYFWLPCSHVNTSVKKRPREDVVLGFRLAARLFAQSCSRPCSPGQAKASGQVSSKDGLNPARDGQPGPDTQAHLTGEDIRTWSKITCF